MSDVEVDPYAVSSDDDDDDTPKGPPPKITIAGRTDMHDIKQSLVNDENKAFVRDANTQKEIEALRQAMAQEMKAMKADFEQGTAGGAAPGYQKQWAHELLGLDRETLAAFKDKFENLDATLDANMREKLQGKFDELEHLSVEAAALRQRFEQAAQSGELTEEKRLQLEDEFATLRDERERAKRELAEEQAEAAALLVAQKEAAGSDVQVTAEHAQKMANKWEKITAKEAKKAEKGKMKY